ncbi:hypothetical protein [Litoreibacter roseus]|uniref:Uncharacterized protein n=1 Tax=Litoreibacter roseus TaxID=2601869 RepID=A0A6N6JH13_9RHOB|nr:hypothetical protein [Litoreibacter roseus]GFE65130.1 hypothetical protein KIN_22040 [Litoreibacter roseus]
MVEKSKEIASLKDFDELYELVRPIKDRIHGVGPLLHYDVCLRIATGFLEVKPELIYVHAGAKEGARALGLNTSNGKLKKDDFPAEVKRLDSAEDIEVFLCVKKDALKALRYNS